MLLLAAWADLSYAEIALALDPEGRTLQLSWLPTSDAGPAIGPAKEPGAEPELEFGTSEGHRATVWRYRGTDDYTAVWRDGETTVIARGEMAAAFAGLGPEPPERRRRRVAPRPA